MKLLVNLFHSLSFFTDYPNFCFVSFFYQWNLTPTLRRWPRQAMLVKAKSTRGQTSATLVETLWIAFCMKTNLLKHLEILDCLRLKVCRITVQSLMLKGKHPRWSQGCVLCYWQYYWWQQSLTTISIIIKIIYCQYCQWKQFWFIIRIWVQNLLFCKNCPILLVCM